MSHESAELLEPTAERESRWIADQEKIDQLDSLTPETLAPAFEGEEGICSCVDEGMDGDIRLAGSGILHPGGIDAVAEILRGQKTKEVRSHDNCSAAKEAYRRANNLPVDAEIDPAVVNAYAAQWAIDLSTKLNARASHATAEVMKRPADWHDASTIYLDFSGNFQPHEVPELPQGFVFSGRLATLEDLAQSARFTAEIALSDNGFGERFSAEQPLTVVIVGEAGADHEARLTELLKDFDGRVTIRRLAVPEVATTEAA